MRRCIDLPCSLYRAADFKTLWALLLILLLTTTQAQANDPVRAALAQVLPNAEDVAISDSPIAGYKQVALDANVIYVSEDGQYLIQGKLFDLKTRMDLTEEAVSKQRKDIIGEADKTQMISFAPEDPQHEIFVFTDIDCGYCRRLHGQVEDYNRLGIAVHYLFLPRSGLASPSFEKAANVWCADNQQLAFTAAKLGEQPKSNACVHPIGEQLALGQKMGVTRTPTIVLDDGSVVLGYMPPQSLLEHLEQRVAIGRQTSALK
jgi:thiol:disulfide interchange protein DsbC